MIINSSNNLYNWQELEGSATFTGETVMTAAGTLVVRVLYGSATFTGETTMTAAGNGIQDGASVFRGETVMTARGHTRVPLALPEPILNEIAENAFANRYYDARLLDNLGNEIKFTQATIDKPRDAVGMRVSIDVAEKDLSLITNDKTYTFQTGTRETPTGAITWKTIVENGKLNSRNFALGQNANLPADSLSFGTIEPLKNRLNKYPLDNVVLYNSRRTTVELSQGDVIRDTAGNQMETNVVAINYMTLYDVLGYLKKACGFSDIVTNIPNFEMTRADFPFTSTYNQSIGAIIGIFEPVFFTVGSVLYILDKTGPVPEEFTPRALENATLSNWSITIPDNQEIDGYLVSYTADESQANYFTDRLVQTEEESGDFGDDDFTKTETETTYREWRAFSAPDEILRSEIVSIKKETYKGLATLVGRRTETHSFDSQGRRTGTTVETLALVPDLAAAGAPSLQTVREENQAVYYQTDPKNPRRSLQSRVVTRIRGLISVDEANTYFDPDSETGEQAAFRQDYLEAHKAGNLTEDMTADYGPLKTVTETLLNLGNGQYQVSVSTVDHLRKTETNSFSEPKTGDASLLSSLGKQNQIIVLKDGLTLATRPGNAIEPLSIGETPLYFGIPLVERKIERRDAQKQSGNVNVIGYSDSIERGTFFTLYDRQSALIGIFLTMGVQVVITPMGDGAQILTSIDADEI